MMDPLIWVMGPMLLKKRISWKFVSWFLETKGDFFGWGDGDGEKWWEFSKRDGTLPIPVLEESVCKFRWVFPKIGVPQNGWFIMENPIKMDDLGVPPF